MTDEEILHAAQARLEAKRAAMTHSDRYHSFDCTWLSDRTTPDPNCWECSPVTEDEKQMAVEKVRRAIARKREGSE